MLIRKHGLTLLCGILLALAGCRTTGSGEPAAFASAPGASPQALVGSLVKPEGPGPFPAVVLLHSCGGVGDHLATWSSFLKTKGYAALTVDSFGSRRLGPCPNGTSPLYFSANEMVSDAYGALDWLAAQPDIQADHIYVMGFSLGGWTVNELTKQPSRSRDKRNFHGGVALYAPCYYQGRLAFPAMTVIGSLDGPEEASCELAVERKPSPDAEVHILPGVYHAFDQPTGGRIMKDSGGRPMLYDAAAVAKAQDLVADFLARHS
jgi:dienelactone hydrolase